MNKEETKHKDILLVYGSGECDQLGIDLEEAQSCILSVPTLIPNWSQTIQQVVCGGMHTLVLTGDGRLFSFGCNDDGALGRPEDDTPFIKEVPFEDQVRSICAGDSHSVAVTVNNRLFVWGQYRNVLSGGIGKKVFKPQQVGKYELGRLPIRKIASGSNHTLVLAGKKIFSWGDPECGATGRKNTQSLRIQALRSQAPIDVWAGSYFSFYKDAKGRVYSFGLNNYGQLGLGNTVDRHEPTMIKNAPNFIQIAGGEHHAIGLTDQGEVYGWGRNDDSQLGFDNQDDQVHCERPKRITSFDERIKRIVVGGHYSYAVSDKNRLYSWQEMRILRGFGDQYVLANESQQTESKPYKVGLSFFPRGFNVKSIGCGGQHVVVGGQLSDSGIKEQTEISMSNMKREINQIVNRKKTFRQREQELGGVIEEPQKRAKVTGFFVNAQQEERIRSFGSYRGVTGMTEDQLRQEYKEENPPPTTSSQSFSKPSSGFFVDRESENRVSRGYRGVSGMTDQQINQEYKQEESAKPPESQSFFSKVSSSSSSSNPFGQKPPGASNPFASGNTFFFKKPESHSSNPFKKQE